MSNRRKKKRLGDIIINVIFYPFMVIMIAIVIMFGTGVRPYITMSGSMEPEIMTGSICFVNTKADYDDIDVGDVIAYEKSSGLVTHRVIAISESGFETKGDANDVSDGISTQRSNFKGKTLFSIPYLGYAVRTLQKPQVFSAFIVLIIGFVAYMIVDSVDNRVRGKYERKKQPKRKSKDTNTKAKP